MNKFKVVALISSYNEGDVIFHVIGDLISNGISVYLIDNNSTDNTREEAAKWLHKGLINIEIFPDLRNHTHNTKDEFNWRSILGRKEILANTLEADWFINADSDEFREAPWFETTLYEGVRKVDRLGYNTINFELLNFRPINNTYGSFLAEQSKICLSL
jgi:glycosyltransferase involved in cell wall biosynthesis